jgi:hypothetical protein
MVSNVCSDIEEMIRRRRQEQPLSQCPTPVGTKPAHRERYEADYGSTFEQLQLERHFALQKAAVRFVMHEDDPPPFAQKRRCPFDRDETLAREFAR